MHFTRNTILLSLAALAAAKTDYDGCTSFTTTITAANGNPGNGYAYIIYYDPDNLEICQRVDCGGGRAPPKTTQPGCPRYEGTETLRPSYLKYDPAEVLQAGQTGATPAAATASATATAEAGEEGETITETSSGITTVVTPTGTASAEEEEDGAEGTAEETFAAPTVASGGSEAGGDVDTVGENAAARNGFAFAVPAVLGSLVVAVMA